MPLILDRIALDDVGANPGRIAAAIHRQLGEGRGPVPVLDIARALDIVEVRVEPLTNFEGALITTPERGRGSILVNKSSGRQRQRFTVGHELLHFLSPVHRPASSDGFWCSRRDMAEYDVDSLDLYRRQEAEANAFAIELLAPLPRIRPHLQSVPNLASVVSLANELDISKEAAVRRYVECHGEMLAVVFSRGGRLIYSERSKEFPALALRRSVAVPELPQATDHSGLTPIEEAETDEWLAKPNGVQLAVQTLHQQNGHAITLLHIVSTEDSEENGGIDDTYQRFKRLES